LSRKITTLLAGLVGLGTGYGNAWRRAQRRLMVSEQLHQHHRVATKHGVLIFVSTHLRALEAPRNFHGAEPETLAWIDSFAPGAVLWDIGANVGMYTLYAGKRGDLDVFAFEPSPFSYAALCTNLAANELDRVSAYCIALSERTQLGTLNMPRTYPGSVYNAFEDRVEVTMTGDRVTVELRQAAVGICADDLVDEFGAAPPNHIKLDVDSTEVAILRGAARLLRSPTLLSISVENTLHDTPQNRAIDALLGEAGFQAESCGRGGSDVTVNVIYRR